MTRVTDCGRGRTDDAVVDLSPDDSRVRDVAILPAPDVLRAQIPCLPDVAAHVARTRTRIHDVVTGVDPRLLVVVGPCSIHDVAAAREYAAWLADQAARWRTTLTIAMRVYVEKPRTRGGWQGLLDDPLLDGSGRLDLGLAWARRLLRDVNELGLPAATEFVDVITPQYLADFVSWTAIGARTTESPVHRQLASGLASPVGFKNSLSGDVQAAVNAVVAARVPQRLVSVARDGRPAVLSTTGNPDCHVILRGGTGGPNYDEASIAAAAALLRGIGAPPRVMIDCGHGNCGGDYRRQVEVAQATAGYLRDGGREVMGVMLESALVEGRQPLSSPDRLVHGQSVTDGCLGLDDTARVLGELARAVRSAG